MNVVASYLARHSDRLELPFRTEIAALQWITLTPRFRTSAHVVLLAGRVGCADPVLVAKAARLPGRSDALTREAATLRAVQSARPGGFDSIPRLLTEDVVAGSHLIVETGLPGRPFPPAVIRRRRHGCASALTRWVTELHQATALPPADPAATFDRLVTGPLRELGRCVPTSADVHDLIARTLAVTRPLSEVAVPLVMEHGDLGAPNILASRAGALGVVDWELAEPRSLPAQDLFFGLAYLASAHAGAASPRDHIAAFDRAFFGADAWAAPYVASYVEALQLPHAALRPLFVACWSRYVAKRATRLVGPDDRCLDPDAAAWLAADRFHGYWRHAVDHVHRLFIALPLRAHPRPAEP